MPPRQTPGSRSKPRKPKPAAPKPPREEGAAPPPPESPPPPAAENGAVDPQLAELAAQMIEEPRPETPIGRRLYGLVSNMALGFMLAGDEHCATVLSSNAGSLAVAWERLAKTNARVRQVLTMLTSGGEWGEAVIATLAVGIPIAQHHGAYPVHWPNPFNLGMVPPSDEVRDHQHQQPPGPTPGERQPPAGGDETPLGGGGPPASD